MKIKAARFLVSNSDYKKCPDDGKSEFAFIGRSNVGKSSLINMLTDRKALAKVSGKPGKTQLINHFEINEQWYLVDLPGYGYAKLPANLRKTFMPMIKNYLLKRETLKLVFLLLDVRRKPDQFEKDLIELITSNEIPILITITKADKLSKNKPTK